MTLISCQKQSGNVLFLILIAVALFAALSYVVSSSTRTGSGTTERERLQLTVSEIFNYVTAVQVGLTRLQSVGCKENQISFNNPVDAAAAAAYAFTEDYNNTNAPPNHSCDIFHPAGGAVAYKDVPANWIESTDPSLKRFFYTTGDAVQNIGTDCANDACTEINMNLWSISKKLCEAINDKLGYHYLNANIPTDALFGCPFSGEYSCGGGVNAVFTNPALAGKSLVCYNDNNFGYVFNAVLQAR